MIQIDLFFFVMVLVLGMTAAAAVGAALWGRAAKRDAIADKAWLLANTVFKATFMAELRALEVDAQGILALLGKGGAGSGEYFSGKLQAFRDVIVKLGGKIYGK